MLLLAAGIFILVRSIFIQDVGMIPAAIRVGVILRAWCCALVLAIPASTWADSWDGAYDWSQIADFYPGIKFIAVTNTLGRLLRKGCRMEECAQEKDESLHIVTFVFPHTAGSLRWN